MKPTQLFDQSGLDALSDALVIGEGALSHDEVTKFLRLCGLVVPPPKMSRKNRLAVALANSQNTLRNSVKIYRFIEMAATPARFINRPGAHDEYLMELNQVLAFRGKAVGKNGKVVDGNVAATVSEAHQRASELRSAMSARGCHPDVLRFCNEELLAENYFHAVLEAVKSMAQKIRDKTGLDGDGNDLAQRAFGGNKPLWAINAGITETQKGEQRGFCNLLVGIFGMIRNPLAHEPKIYWEMNRDDAEDLLSLLSLVHRRIDAAYMKPRV